MRYENLPQEAQDVVDKVAKHLATQRKQSLDLRGLSVYRSPNGYRCSIGALIPDDLYCPSMEDKDLQELVYSPGMGEVSKHLFGLMPSLKRGQAMLVLEATQTYHDISISGLLGPSYRQDLQDLGELDDKSLETVIRQHICRHIPQSAFKEAA